MIKIKNDSSRACAHGKQWSMKHISTSVLKALLPSAILALALTACGGSSSGGGSTPAASPIKLYASSSQLKAMLQKTLGSHAADVTSVKFVVLDANTGSQVDSIDVNLGSDSKEQLHQTSKSYSMKGSYEIAAETPVYSVDGYSCTIPSHTKIAQKEDFKNPPHFQYTCSKTQPPPQPAATSPIKFSVTSTSADGHKSATKVPVKFDILDGSGKRLDPAVTVPAELGTITPKQELHTTTSYDTTKSYQILAPANYSVGGYTCSLAANESRVPEDFTNPPSFNYTCTTVPPAKQTIQFEVKAETKDAAGANQAQLRALHAAATSQLTFDLNSGTPPQTLTSYSPTQSFDAHGSWPISFPTAYATNAKYTITVKQTDYTVEKGSDKYQCALAPSSQQTQPVSFDSQNQPIFTFDCKSLAPPPAPKPATGLEVVNYVSKLQAYPGLTARGYVVLKNTSATNDLMVNAPTFVNSQPAHEGYQGAYTSADESGVSIDTTSNDSAYMPVADLQSKASTSVLPAACSFTSGHATLSHGQTCYFRITYAAPPTQQTPASAAVTSKSVSMNINYDDAADSSSHGVAITEPIRTIALPYNHFETQQDVAQYGMLASNHVNKVFVDDGVQYIATDSGLTIIANGITRTYTMTDGLASNNVHSVYALTYSSDPKNPSQNKTIVFAATDAGLSVARVNADGELINAAGKFTNNAFTTVSSQPLGNDANPAWRVVAALAAPRSSTINYWVAEDDKGLWSGKLAANADLKSIGSMSASKAYKNDARCSELVLVPGHPTAKGDTYATQPLIVYAGASTSTPHSVSVSAIKADAATAMTTELSIGLYPRISLAVLPPSYATGVNDSKYPFYAEVTSVANAASNVKIYQGYFDSSTSAKSPWKMPSSQGVAPTNDVKVKVTSANGIFALKDNLKANDKSPQNSDSAGTDIYLSTDDGLYKVVANVVQADWISPSNNPFKMVTLNPDNPLQNFDVQAVDGNNLYAASDEGVAELMPGKDLTSKDVTLVSSMAMSSDAASAIYSGSPFNTDTSTVSKIGSVFTNDTAHQWADSSTTRSLLVAHHYVTRLAAVGSTVVKGGGLDAMSNVSSQMPLGTGVVTPVTLAAAGANGPGTSLAVTSNYYVDPTTAKVYFGADNLTIGGEAGPGQSGGGLYSVDLTQATPQVKSVKLTPAPPTAEASVTYGEIRSVVRGSATDLVDLFARGSDQSNGTALTGGLYTVNLQKTPTISAPTTKARSSLNTNAAFKNSNSLLYASPLIPSTLSSQEYLIGDGAADDKGVKKSFGVLSNAFLTNTDNKNLPQDTIPYFNINAVTTNPPTIQDMSFDKDNRKFDHFALATKSQGLWFFYGNQTLAGDISHSGPPNWQPIKVTGMSQKADVEKVFTSGSIDATGDYSGAKAKQGFVLVAYKDAPYSGPTQLRYIKYSVSSAPDYIIKVGKSVAFNSINGFLQTHNSSVLNMTVIRSKDDSLWYVYVSTTDGLLMTVLNPSQLNA